MFKKIGISTVLIIASSNSYSQNNIYTTIGAGWTIPSKNSSTISDSGFTHYGPTATPSNESFFNLPNVNYINSYKDGYNLNAAIGYRLFSAVRADVEFLYQSFHRDITGTYGWAEYDANSAALFDSRNGIVMVPTSAPVNVYTILTNIYYDFFTKTKWTPLVGAGFGIAWLESKSTSANGSFTTINTHPTITPTLQYTPKLSGTAFAWQFKAGVGYDYSKNVSIVMLYRLFATTSFTSEPTSITTNPTAGPATRRVFRISQQFVRGLFTNSLELQLKFDFA